MIKRYITRGTCSRAINIEIDGDRIVDVVFEGGCSGNTQGISALVKGMEIKDVIKKFSGIRCGMKPTSCPDQLARALSEIIKEEEKSEMWKTNRDKWLESEYVDEATKNEIRNITDTDELKMRFSSTLSFGTAGQRGVMGAGLNRLNVYTVRYTTRALAELIRKCGKEAMERGVVIAYDCRLNSDVFGFEAAAVLAENGIKAKIFDKLTPTPVLSYAIRELKATAGINITASHNPVEYNGYKVYWENGAQLPPKEAAVVASELEKLDIFRDCRCKPYTEYQKSGLIELLDGTIEKRFCDEILSRRFTDEKAGLSVVYTPLHGTGVRAVPYVLEKIGAEITKVEKQMISDGHFPTVPSPNPENPSAFELAIQTAKNGGNKADLLIATDPDADRIGVLVRTNDGYKLLSGNQAGIIMLYYILSVRKKNGTLPANGGTITTIVSTPLAGEIAESFGVKYVETFTGFKFIAETIDNWKDDYKFLFGFEESFGYMVGDYVRDKDSVGAAVMICDAAAYWKKEGKTLCDVLAEIYARYGYHYEVTDNIMMKGIDGPEKTAALMRKLRLGMKTVGGMKVIEKADYNEQKITNLQDGTVRNTGMERSNVLKFFLEGGSAVCIRPSGTEPKVKIYYLIKGINEKECREIFEKIKSEINALAGI